MEKGGYKGTSHHKRLEHLRRALRPEKQPKKKRDIQPQAGFGDDQLEGVSNGK